MYKTTINLGRNSTEIDIHPNAPVVINFYRITSRGKVYNRNERRMHYTTENNVEWTLNWFNSKFSDFGKVVYYRAN